jgi:phosphoglycolate phosphatase
MATNRPLLRGIVFDFDGTLAELNINFPGMRQGVRDLISNYNVPAGDHALKDLFVLEMITAGAALVSQYQPGKEADFIAAAHERIAQIEMEAARRGSLFEGTRGMLEALQAAAIKTGVVTRNCLTAVKALFPDIHQYAHAVITREQTSYVKPHPEHLRMMLKALEVNAEHAAMVGDHPMDIKIGKDIGVYTIGVLTGHSGREELERAGADLILNAATDIPDMLAQHALPPQPPDSHR